jgi:ATP-binding cassette subfamily F protein 3
LKRRQKERQLEQWGGFIEETDDQDQFEDDLYQNTIIDPTLGRGRSRDIKLENFDISYGGKTLLRNANVTFAFGKRYGLIGRNGIGKSSLLRAIARREIQGIPEWLRILHVAQEVHGDDTPVLTSVLSADAYRVALLRRERDIQKALDDGLHMEQDEKDKLSSELKQIYGKLEFIEADKAESRASTILSGLGFSPEEQKQPTKSFSGGWRMRIALARALFCKPDVLLW